MNYEDGMSSIGFRLINWLGHVRDEVTKKPVKVLRGSEVHPVPSRDLDEPIVVHIDNGLSEADMHNTVVVPEFRKNVDIRNRHTAVSYLPPFATYGHLSSGLNHNFILRHQKPPAGVRTLVIRQDEESSEER